MEPKTTGRRFVSKGEYVRVQANRATTSVSGLGYAILGVVCGVVTITLTLAFGYHLCFPTRDFLLNRYVVKVRGTDQVSELIGMLIFNSFILVLFGGLAYEMSMFGYDLLRKATRLDPGVPFTSANTADLPAPESLVRASEELMQAQEAVLLRAAMEGPETPPEQLVRAVNE